MSLLLCLLTSVLWYSSEPMGYLLCRGDSDGGVQWCVAAGEFSVFKAWGEVAPDNYPFVDTGGRWRLTRFLVAGTLPYARDSVVGKFGFKYRPSHLLWSHFKQIAIPMWALALVFGTLPAIWVRRRYVAWDRRVRGRCVNCGYDLTANVCGVCPECGDRCV